MGRLVQMGRLVRMGDVFKEATALKWCLSQLLSSWRLRFGGLDMAACSRSRLLCQRLVHDSAGLAAYRRSKTEDRRQKIKKKDSEGVLTMAGLHSICSWSTDLSTSPRHTASEEAFSKWVLLQGQVIPPSDHRNKVLVPGFTRASSGAMWTFETIICGHKLRVFRSENLATNTL